MILSLCHGADFDLLVNEEITPKDILLSKNSSFFGEFFDNVKNRDVWRSTFHSFFSDEIKRKKKSDHEKGKMGEITAVPQVQKYKTFRISSLWK